MSEEVGWALPLDISCSKGFVDWLSDTGVSVVFTAPRSGKIYFVGLNENRTLSVFERGFEKARAIHGVHDTLYLGSLYQLWRFENVLSEGQEAEGYDRLYLPQTAYTTGDLDIHDIATDDQGEIYFVNTLFNCIATVSDRHSFLPVWRPSFVESLTAGDRCHLTGMAMVDGEIAYATVAGRSDRVDGWRDDVWDGGSLIEVPSGRTVVSGLSLPHGPRFRDGKLWLMDSGSGHFGHVDLDRGVFEPMVLCPGYLRDIDFVDRFAVVAISARRDGVVIDGLKLGGNLEEKNAYPQCAIAVIDLEEGALVHWMRLTGSIQEIGGVAALEGSRRPAAIGLMTDEVCRVLSVGPDHALPAGRHQMPRRQAGG
ncbi:MAG: TIGR03032 family protein [Alphaproteobacteria bacterium]|nr:TIGR03032 family protein [Alphaproteobacteria bacterium]